MNRSLSGFDLAKYEPAVAYISRLSRLFSSSDQAYIVYRFVEKLFCATAGAEDIASSDISFDAKRQSSGFGIKTFLANSKNSRSSEKVAEFTRDAANGEFASLPHENLAHRVSELRNKRLASNAAEIGVQMSASIYHCLVRIPGAAFVHEEPYDLISLEDIRPITVSGKELDKFPSKTEGTVYFSDGKNSYKFLTAKNTLFKTFDLGSGYSSKMLSTPIDDTIWEQVIGAPFVDLQVGNPAPLEDSEEGFGQNVVVLPLYSTRSSVIKKVQESAAINLWLADGRPRKFGEAYISIPQAVHRTRPGFFPPRDSKFRLILPDGEVVSAKVCQENDKALMSDPNDALCRWLFKVIDGSEELAKKRLAEGKGYTYEDLLEIGKDSVLVRKNLETGDYHLSSAKVGTYERFLGEAT